MVIAVFHFEDSYVTLPSVKALHIVVFVENCAMDWIYFAPVIKMQAYHLIQSPSVAILYSPSRSPPCLTVSAASSQPAS